MHPSSSELREVGGGGFVKPVVRAVYDLVTAELHLHTQPVRAGELGVAAGGEQQVLTEVGFLPVECQAGLQLPPAVEVALKEEGVFSKHQ